MASKATARVSNSIWETLQHTTNQSHLQLPYFALVELMQVLVVPASILTLQSKHFLTSYYSPNTLGQLNQ